MSVKPVLFVCLLLAISWRAFAQQEYAISRSFTMADGLPSNHIYTCVEDDKGFLWIATDAGIARFDGKNFQVFTRAQGLPDDEVLNVVKENNGRIWVNCFKQSPAYFDEAKNRFVNAREDTSLGKPQNANLIYLSALPAGGVIYSTANRSYVFKKDLYYELSVPYSGSSYSTVIEQLADGSFISLVNSSDLRNWYLVKVKQGKITDSLSFLHDSKPMEMKYFIDHDKVYIQNQTKTGYYILSAIRTEPLGCKLDSMQVTDRQIIWQNASRGFFNVIDKSGVAFVFDDKTGALLFRLKADYSANAVYHDRAGNIWVSSIDKGMFLYKKKQVAMMKVPDGFTNNFFLSIAVTANGSILAGNYFGQIIESGPHALNIHSIPDGTLSTSWQRKIILSQNKVFTFSEGGSYIDFKQPLYLHNGMAMSSKTAVVLNDSILVEGSFGSLRAVNTVTGKVSTLGGLPKRATCLSVAPGPMIYHGSTDGLYKFDYTKMKDIDLTVSNRAFSERITAIYADDNGLVWVGTASNGVMLLSGDSLLNSFSTGTGMISNNVKCITAGKPGEYWIGTTAGISIIRYTVNNPVAECHNLSLSDGLSSNIINEMLFYHDTVWCATANGVCGIPANINIQTFDIPVVLTGIKINNADTSVMSSYRLSYDENNLTLRFAGIELGGHFRYFQYKTDKGSWNNIDGNILDIQLNSGDHIIAVRAVDVNMQYGSKPLLLKFHIGIPLWRSHWLWISLVVTGIVLFAWLFRRREMAKREIALQGMLNQKKMTELELQALKSQIDPHFIFNCLNSIKLLNHTQQYGIAENYLDRFAALLRSALEQSSVQLISLQQEIDFISNYLALEKLRFPNKLFYELQYDAGLDTAGIHIPSMLLQPYIENAIKHGIIPLKDKAGIIFIRFKQESDILLVEIEDNGNGINAMAGETAGNGIGIMNTQRRSKLYNIEYDIYNLSNANQQVCGTMVRLRIHLNDPKLKSLAV